MNRSVSARLAAYLSVAAVAVFLGMSTGRPELLAIAAGVLAVVVLGLAATTPPLPTVDLAMSAERVIEGDSVTMSVVLSNDFEIDADVAPALPGGIDPVDGVRRMSVLLGRRPRCIDFHLDAARWGAYRVGDLALRYSGPGDLVRFEGFVDRTQPVKVYPAPAGLTRGLVPEHAYAYSGDYPSRAAGPGIEFADVRPYARGDSAKRVNWRVTSRRGKLHVNLQHPERDAELVLLLDAFSDIEVGGRTTLELTVQGAAALAEYHLRHNDRVGLIAFGGLMRWLNASMGRRHAYRVADFLLDVKASSSYAWKDLSRLPLPTLPPGATVAAFSTLVDERFIRALGDLAAGGWPVVVVDTLDEAHVPAGRGTEAGIAHRAWKLHRQTTREELTDAGIPVVTWAQTSSIDAVVASFPRRRRMRARR